MLSFQYWAVVLLVARLVCAKIIEATDADFESVAFGKPGVYSLVNFYAHNCQHCQALRPNWGPLGQLYNGTNLQLVQVNGRENKRVRTQYNIIGFPTVKLYASDGEQIAAFSHRGDRSTENLITFIDDYTNIKPDLSILKAKQVQTLGEVQNLKDNTLVLFTAPWVKEFENKYNNVFENMARVFPEIDFLIVDTGNPELGQLSTDFRISEIPTLLHYKDSQYYKLTDRLTPQVVKDLLNGEEVGQVIFQEEDPEDKDQEDEAGDDDDDEMAHFRQEL